MAEETTCGVTSPTLDCEPESQGRGVLSPILQDELATRKDIGLVSRAVKRWNLPDEKKQMLSERLFDIVEKTSVQVVTKHGLEDLEAPADANAIAAARVLVTMEGQVQADDMPQIKQETNVAVNVGIGIRVVSGEGALPL